LNLSYNIHESAAIWIVQGQAFIFVIV